jgi:hypothetical protein
MHLYICSFIEHYRQTKMYCIKIKCKRRAQDFRTNVLPCNLFLHNIFDVLAKITYDGTAKPVHIGYEETQHDCTESVCIASSNKPTWLWYASTMTCSQQLLNRNNVSIVGAVQNGN